MNLHAPFAETFSANTLTVFETEHWVVLLRKKQVTLGSLVLAVKRNFISASEMTPEENKEFPIVVGRLEKILQKAFAFDVINYLCYMLVDRHYHFHVIPRYKSERVFNEKTWIDSGWPSFPHMSVEAETDEMLKKLKIHLKTFDES